MGFVDAERAVGGGVEGGGPQQLPAHRARQLALSVLEADRAGGRVIAQAGHLHPLGLDQLLFGGALQVVDDDPGAMAGGIGGERGADHRRRGRQVAVDRQGLGMSGQAGGQRQ